MSCHSKYLEYGFNYKEISDFLAERSVSLGARHSPDPLIGFPEWAHGLASISAFTVDQTQYILAGCNPFDSTYLNSAMKVELAIANHFLWDAIENGKLTPYKKSNGQDALKQDDVRTWCDSIGKAWCIPLPDKPTVKSELVAQMATGEDVVLDRLQQSERENAILLAEKNELTDSLTKVQATKNQQKQQLTDTTDSLTVAIREKASFQTEFDVLKADALEGKTKSTLQKILGGVVMKGYGKDIHANRISGISEIVSDLALCGVLIKEDTLSKHLKAAAQLITKPK